MNCKPGDLAVVVRSDAGNVGKVLTTIRLATAQELVRLGYRPPPFPVWITDGLFPDICGSLDSTIADHQLRPLRNNPGNESWFTAAPRSKPATTKGDTIDARGMVRS